MTRRILIFLFPVIVLFCCLRNLQAEEPKVPTVEPSAPAESSAEPVKTASRDLSAGSQDKLAVEKSDKPENGSPGGKETTEDLQAKRQQVAQRVNDVQKSLESAKESGTGVPQSAERLTQEVELLKQLDVLYAQLQSAEEFRKEAEANKSDLEKNSAISVRADRPKNAPIHFWRLMDCAIPWQRRKVVPQH